MDDSCLDNVIVSIPEIDVVEQRPVDAAIDVLEKDVSASTGVNNVVSKKKIRRKRRSSKCRVNSVEQDNVIVSIPETDVVEEIPVDAAIGVLEKEVSASAGVNDVVSKKRRRKPKHSSSECGVNSVGQDNVIVSIPETDVLENVPSSLTTSVLENDVSAGVNNVVSKRNNRRKRKRNSPVCGVNAIAQDNVSVIIPETNVLEEVPSNSITSVLEKDVLAGVNDVVLKKKKRKPKCSSSNSIEQDNVSVRISETDALEKAPPNVTTSFLDNDVSGEVNNVISKKKKRRRSTVGVLEKEVLAGVNDVVPKKTKRKAKRKEMNDYGSTCLDNASVGAPKTDVLEEVPIESNLTSSPEEFHSSPIDTTMGVLDKEVSASAGVNDAVSKKRKRKLKCLDNVSVGTPINDVVEEVPLESNLTCSSEKLHTSPVNTTMDELEKEVLDGVNVPESKKRKKKPKLCSSKSGEKSVAPEMSDHSLDNVSVSITKGDVLEEVPAQVSKKRKRKSKLKEMNDCSPIERTCLDNASVKPVSAVADNISSCDINNDIMAIDNLVATCSVNVDSNGKPLEAKDVCVIPPAKSKRKHRSSSSSEVTNPSLQLSTPLDTTTTLKCRKKLLVLDVNGLLADIVPQCPKRFKPDFTLAKKIVFKRPFCDDFLQFCFEKFDVGIWSSRTKKNLTRAVDLLMNNMKDKLLFCWDGSHCTNTGLKTLEDKHKPLVLKEMKKLWEDKANCLPLQKGFYNESNTILLDDSPYKALRNPPYTAIYPRPYSFTDVGDKSLGPDGDLRLYLERLAEAENVQNFIQANPFGQKPITQAHPSWNFYSKIVRNQTRNGNCYYQRP